VGALASLKFDRGACWGLGCVLIAFGLLGTVFSIVQYGKWTESRQRWRVFRRRLDQLCPRAQLGIALTISKTEMADDFPRWLYASKFPLHWLWTLLNFSVLLLGVALAFQPFGVGKLLARDSRLPPTIQTIKIQQSSSRLKWNHDRLSSRAATSHPSKSDGDGSFNQFLSTRKNCCTRGSDFLN